MGTKMMLVWYGFTLFQKCPKTAVNLSSNNLDSIGLRNKTRKISLKIHSVQNCKSMTCIILPTVWFIRLSVSYSHDTKVDKSVSTHFTRNKEADLDIPLDHHSDAKHAAV